ncbi:hypothetical protein G7068_08985 [Leucobacter viscericola]|uniref:Big-1 domain-containing protein n=1 Tax=Leucobacter viscericola TaxID=2714935 RepID=A0A6G7XFZ4_9MICO|nr:Ig-like domain-containing protein [Leucobacter viscericola]QIK63317.1 hypothetical protein G7068_08985 [Leucobacter viscericola]
MITTQLKRLGRSLTESQQRDQRPSRRRRTLSLALVGLLAAGGAYMEAPSAQAANVQFPVELDFSSGAANDVFASDDFWVFGSPKYTGNSASKSGANGVGWLQLTSSSTYQSSALISKGSMPVAEGATVEFDFRAFANGSAERADGFSFFLLDADEPGFEHSRIGTVGGGLGYTSGCDTNSKGVPGIERGYLGVGFDVYGGFSTTGSGQRNEAPGVTRSSAPDSVVLRGSGDGGAGGNGASVCGKEYLYATGKKLSSGSLSQGSVSDQNAKFRRARIAVIPQESTGPRIVVSVSGLTSVGQQPTTWQNDLLDYQVIPGNGVFNDLPENLRFGFAASTGGKTMTTQIGNVNLSTSTDASIVASPISAKGVEGSASRGDNVSYTLTATNNGPGSINGTSTPGTSRIYQDLSQLGLESAAWTCEGVNGGVCEGTPVQNGTILSQDWSGPVGASVVLSVAATVVESASIGAKSGIAIIPTNFETNTIDPGSSAATTTGSVTDANVNNNSAALSLTVLANASASKSTFGVSTGNRAANGEATHTLTATVRDTENVLRAGETVTFEAPVGVTLSEPTAVSGANGVASVTATSTVAASYAVSAKLGANQIGTNQNITFVADAPSVGEGSTSSFGVTTGSLPADGEATHTVTATILDAHNNPVKDQVVTFTSPAGTQLNSATATTNAAGVATTTITATVAGVHQVTASVLGTPLTGTETTATFEAGSNSIGADGTSEVVVTTDERIANGEDTQTVTATIRDANNNPKSGVTVDFAAENDDADVKTASAVTNAAGVAETTVTSSVAGAYDIAATVGGVAIKGSPVSAVFVAGAPTFGADGSSTFAVTSGDVEANGAASHRATATVLDAQGNPVEGVTVDFAVANGAELSEASIVTNEQGIAETLVTSSAAGTYAVSAKVGTDSIKGSPADVTFIAGAPSSNTSTWAVTPNGPVAADGSEAYTATVTVKDVKNNPVKDATVGFVVPAGLTQVPGSLTTNASGQVTADFTATVADDYTLVAQLGAEQIGSSKVLTFVAGEASANSSTIAVTPEYVEANGSHEAVVTVAIFDAQGNAVVDAGDIVSIHSSHGDDVPVTKLADGTYQAKFTSTNAGVATFTFSVDGDESEETASATFVATPNAPVMNRTNGIAVTGTANPGHTVQIRNAANVVVGTAVADAVTGKFSITPTVALADEEQITATATDEHGFTSFATPVTIDKKAPATPEVGASNGKKITGGPIAEGDEVTVVDGDGNPIEGEVTINEDGTFTFVPKTPFEEGDVVKVIVTSPAGNSTDPVDVFIKTTPPTVPVVDPSNGKNLTGGPIAEGDEVLVLDKNGDKVPGKVVVDGDGKFTFTPDTPFTEEDEITVVVKDPAGNTSESDGVFIKTTPPTVPVVDPSNGKNVTGGPVAEGDEVLVLDKNGDKVPGVVTVDPDGKFTFTPDTPFIEEDEITVVIKDPAGNTSEPEDVFVKTTPPTVPVVDPSNGKNVTGGPIAEGDEVLVLDKNGDKVPGKVVVDDDGKFTFTPDTPFTEEDEITVVIKDPAGNTSKPEGVFVKTTPPTVPVVDPSNGKNVTGGPVAEGDEVLVLDKNGDKVPGVVTVDPDGKFTFTPDTPFTEDDEITVVVMDPAGNTSKPEDVFIKTTPPTVPVVDPSNGKNITGGPIAEGDEVLVLDKNGDKVPGVVTVDPDGKFTFTPDTPFTEEDEITVVVKDPAGNTSKPEDVFIKTTPPTAPVVDPSNGKNITGGPIAEGDEVLVLDKNGNKVPGKVEIDENGKFTFVPKTPLTEDQQIAVVVKDPAGNTSEPQSVFIKSTPPVAPVVDPTNGTIVTGGVIAKGHVVTIVDSKGATIPGVLGVDEQGHFTFTPETPLTEGMGARVVVTDEVGNSVEVPVKIDTVKPQAPVVDPSDGNTVTGCAEPGSTVTIRDAHGNVIGTAIAGDDCRFEVELSPKQDKSSEISIDVTSPSGNVSETVKVKVGLTSLMLEGGRLKAGETQIARGFGYQPGETVTGVLHSDPIDLGTQVANKKGEVVFEFTIPADLELGDHTVTVESKFSGKLSQTFEVYEQASVWVELAKTGGDLGLPLGLGAVLMLIGAGAMIVKRRRGETAEQGL